MQALYQLDLRGPADDDCGVEDMCRLHLRVDREEDPRAPSTDTTGSELNAAEREILQFAVRLTEGAIAHQEEIDRKLQAVARNWDLRRMAIVDRNVLRMAVYELTWCDDVPPKVAINEAIEIGKKYSTANSGGFVNGILDRIRIDLAEGADDAAADAIGG